MDVYFDEHSFLNVWEKLVDVFFGFDIVFAFFTAYIDTSYGENIQSQKLIAKHYFKSGFIFDFISTTPLFMKPLIAAFTESGSS